ncbi:hypothetical protein ACFQY5_38575 [Paeniroseomonas aquatica]|uniref:hypothetical protein n=1 Tax=Paeniroseomonas aquatica TaxID=373043 RepID=UPI0036129117
MPSDRFIANASAALPSRNSPAISRSRSVRCRRVVNFRHRLRPQRPAHQVDHGASLDALALLVVAHGDDAEPVLLAQP